MEARTAVVTGAAGTIGQGAVARLLKDGRRVAMVDLDEGKLLDAAERFPRDSVMTIAVDITAEDAPAAIDEAVRRRWKPVGILVNNAGISPKKNGVSAGLLEITREEWLHVYEVNVTAALMLARQFLPAMLESRWGRIINISSRAARSNIVNAGLAYVTSKTALLGMTRWIACEYASRGITCNAVAPGAVLSAMTSHVSPERIKRLLENTPVGRAGEAEELGAAIAFLASEDAGFITGVCLDVNGGQPML